MKSKATLVLMLVLLLAAAGGLWAAGTELTVSGSADTSHYCDDGKITINYNLLSTGAADAAEVSYTLDGGSATSLPTVASGNVEEGGGWTFQGRNKTYSNSFDLSGLEPGNHTVTICAVQHGANGNDDKEDCETISFFIQTCSSEADKCDRVGEVFGQVIGNKNVCKSGGTINFQFKGNFGPTAHLTVTGPSPSTTVVRSIDVSRNGESCVYNDSWQGPSGLTAGWYTFKVTTLYNSNTLEDVENLSCSKKN